MMILFDSVYFIMYPRSLGYSREHGRECAARHRRQAANVRTPGPVPGSPPSRCYDVEPGTACAHPRYYSVDVPVWRGSHVTYGTLAWSHWAAVAAVGWCVGQVGGRVRGVHVALYGSLERRIGHASRGWLAGRLAAGWILHLY